MIDGNEKRNRQLAFELQNSHVCEKRSKVFFILSLYKQFICKRHVTQCIRKCTEAYEIFLQKCGAYLRAALKTIVIPISTFVRE